MPHGLVSILTVIALELFEDIIFFIPFQTFFKSLMFS